MKQEVHLRCVIQENARRICELHRSGRVFDVQYDALAFPGGYRAGLKKIAAGDLRSLEAALTFLELRPYFFRSQYIRTKLIRLPKRANPGARQAERFQRVLAKEREWKASKSKLRNAER